MRIYMFRKPSILYRFSRDVVQSAPYRYVTANTVVWYLYLQKKNIYMKKRFFILPCLAIYVARRCRYRYLYKLPVTGRCERAINRSSRVSIARARAYPRTLFFFYAKSIHTKRVASEYNLIYNMYCARKRLTYVCWREKNRNFHSRDRRASSTSTSSRERASCR